MEPLTSKPFIYIAMDPAHGERLPAILRPLLASGTCDRCGCPVAFHAETRDLATEAARRAGRAFTTLCRACGEVVIAQPGDMAMVTMPTGGLVRDIRRTIAAGN